MLKNKAQIAQKSFKTTPELPGPLSGPWSPCRIGVQFRTCACGHIIFCAPPPPMKSWIRPCLLFIQCVPQPCQNLCFLYNEFYTPMNLYALCHVMFTLVKNYWNEKSNQYIAKEKRDKCLWSNLTLLLKQVGSYGGIYIHEQLWVLYFYLSVCVFMSVCLLFLILYYYIS